MKIVDNLFVKVRKLWNAMFGRNGDGSEIKLIKANPTTAETDPYLSGIEVSGQKYRVLADPDVVQAFVLEYLTDNPDAFEEAIAPLIAPEWDDETAYKVGILLTYQGKQYYCIADAPAGTLPTNTTYFEEKSVADIIEMIKNGSIVTGHSEVADNLTPYSEDSGTTQENPFISQGTGTDNNSVIVTTGTIARQLEKQGNTIVKNQFARPLESTYYGYTNSTVTFSDGIATLLASAKNGRLYTLSSYRFNCPASSKWLFKCDIKLTTGTTEISMTSADGKADTRCENTTNWQTLYKIVDFAEEYSSFWLGVQDTRESDWDNVYVRNLKGHNLTQFFNGNDNIPADLLANPSHFSWYYNGSLAYDAGSLQNCNGRYLKCGQGRQLWNQERSAQYAFLEADGTINNGQWANQYNITDYIICVPNRPVYLYGVYGSLPSVCFYDKDKNFIAGQAYSGATYLSVTAPANATYLKASYREEDKDIFTVSLYYSPEEGGEGYNQHYDYVAHIRIDTGNETLKAFDKKLPSGVIERNTGNITFNGTETGWAKSSTGNVYYLTLDNTTFPYKWSATVKAICNKYTYYGTASADYSLKLSNMEFLVYYASSTSPTVREIAFRNESITSLADWLTYLSNNNLTVQFEYDDDHKTTEQGTPFSEYAPINDYSYMAWFDTDGNLVSIPQGCKLFYPVDYKGFLDDGVMYTNGDFTSLAKLEDIDDSALQARGYYKMQDLSSEITDVANVTWTQKKLHKIGNILFMSCRLTINADLAKLDTIFKVPNGAYNLSLYIVGTAGETPQAYVVSNVGNVQPLSALTSGTELFINATYTV